MVDKPGRRKTPQRWLVSFKRHAHRIVYAFYAFGLLVAFVNIVLPGSYIPVLSFNSYAPAAQPYNWLLTPPSLQPNPGITNYTIFIHVNISSVSFVDGADVSLGAWACAASGYVGKLQSMAIGFDGAYPYPLPSPPTVTVNGPFYGVYLRANNTGGFIAPVCPGTKPASPNTINPILVFPEDNNEITFRSPGNYPLMVNLNFANGTSTPLTFSSDFLAIQSSEARNQGVVAEAGALMGVVAGAFAFTDIVPWARAAVRKRPTAA